MFNKYGVCGFKESEKKDFAFNWLGATVSFKLLGQTIIGKVTGADGYNYTLDVEFDDGQKTVIVSGHFNCFRKV